MVSLFVLITSCLSITCFNIVNPHSAPNDISIQKTSDENDNKDYEKEVDEIQPEYISYFPYTATNCYLNTSINGYFSHPYVAYYRYVSNDYGLFSFNYSGPGASLDIYYSNFYSSNDYLTHVDDIRTDLDMFYFDKNVEYIFEFHMTYSTYTFYYSFTLQAHDASLTNLNNYVLHWEKNPSSTSIGFRYNVEYYGNIDDVNFSPISSNVVMNATSTTYTDAIDSTHNFNLSNDNRKIVDNTAYREHSAIGRIVSSQHIQYYNSDTSRNYYNSSTGYCTVGTGTFIGENVVLTAAHLFYLNGTSPLYTYLAPSIDFYPGIDSYHSASISFGDYHVNNAFLSLSYIIWYKLGGEYGTNCAANDWALLFLTCDLSSSYQHSSMGVMTFSGSSTDSISCGYPCIVNCPSDDETLFDSVQWTNYPIAGSCSNSTATNGQHYISSTYHVISKGNSGGPLYSNSTYIQNGQIVYSSMLFGICSGSYNISNLFVSSWFFRITPFYINLIKEVINNA